MASTRDTLSIASFRWGFRRAHLKDARLFSGGVEEWDWGKTGTRHDPGIQIADLADLVAEYNRRIANERVVALVHSTC